MNQRERIRSLPDGHPRYRNVEIPSDETGQRQPLRALLNVRMPGAIGEDFLNAQNE